MIGLGVLEIGAAIIIGGREYAATANDGAFEVKGQYTMVELVIISEVDPSIIDDFLACDLMLRIESSDLAEGRIEKSKYESYVICSNPTNGIIGAWRIDKGSLLVKRYGERMAVEFDGEGKEIGKVVGRESGADRLALRLDSTGLGKREGLSNSVCSKENIEVIPKLAEWLSNEDRARRAFQLLDRIGSYYQAFKDRSYDAVIDIWAEQFRDDREEEARYFKKMGRNFRTDSWEVKSIRVVGDRAKVRIVIKGRGREGMFRKWKDFSEEETDYWAYEKENWFFIPLQLSDWDDSRAVEVPLQGRR